MRTNHKINKIKKIDRKKERDLRENGLINSPTRMQMRKKIGHPD